MNLNKKTPEKKSRLLFISLLSFLLILTLLLSGCTTEVKTTPPKKVRTVYYDGPELEIINGTIGVIKEERTRRVPPGDVDDWDDEDWEDWEDLEDLEDLDDDEDINADIDDNDGDVLAMTTTNRPDRSQGREPRGGFLQWLPREDEFMEWLPRDERHPDPAEGGEGHTLFAQLFEQHEAQLTFNDDTTLDFMDEPDIQEDPEIEQALPVSGTGEAGGREGGKVYGTIEEHRFKILLGNWHVDRYLVDYHTAEEGPSIGGDSMVGIGMNVVNQGWYWDDMNSNYWVENTNMPWLNDQNGYDVKTENVTALGLKLNASPVDTDYRRSIFLRRVLITNGDDEINITVNPTGAAGFQGGENYTGWLMEIEDYIEGQTLQIPNGPYGEMTWGNGDRFEGRWLDGEREGTGTYIWPDDTTLRAEWKKGVAEGRGILTWPDGAQDYIGLWSNNRFHGQGAMTWYDGQVPTQRYSGLWREGQAHGVGQMTWPDGREYTGGWSEGVIHGRGRMIFPDGRVYTGGFREGAPHGRGAMRLPESGLLYRGVWGNGTPVGRGVFIPREDIR